MELVRELFVTAGFALIFSFLVAKLVSMAMAADSKPAVLVDDDMIAQELKTGEKLEVRGFESERKVDSVGGTSEIVDKFDEKRAQPGLDEALEWEFESGEILAEFESAIKSDDLVKEDTMESGEVEEVREDLHDQIDVAWQSQEIGIAKSQSEGLISFEKKAEKAVSDDDDWEGIERSELEKEFAAAVKFVESKGDAECLGSDLLMELYGLHKIATEGPCRESQPMALKVSARTKWNAWQRWGNMNPEEAMEQYVTLLSDKVPRWTEDNFSLSKGEDKPEYAESGIPGVTSPDISSSPDPQTYSIDEINSELKSAVARGDGSGGSSFLDQVKD